MEAGPALASAEPVPIIKPVPLGMLAQSVFSTARFVPLTNGTTDGNHTNLTGLEATVQTLILVVRVRQDLDVADIVCDLFLETIFALAVVWGSDIPIATSCVRHVVCDDGRARSWEHGV